MKTLTTVFGVGLLGFVLQASPTRASLNLHYSFEGVDPTTGTDVPNLAPGATVNGTLTNVEKIVASTGNIITVGPARYTLGTSLRFISGDPENGEAGHVDTGFLPTDLGVTNENAWNRDYTMMAWVNFGSTTGDNMIFGQLNGASDNVLHNGSRNGSLHSAHWGDDIGPDQGVNVNSLPGTWHHLAYVNQGSTQSIYRDGVLVVGPGATGTNTNNSLTNVLVGTSQNNGSFVGLLDEVKIFGDQVLTPAQIQAEMVQGLTPYTLAALSGATLSATTYTITFEDSGTSVIDLTKTKSLSIDGVDVTGSSTFTKSGAITTITHTPTTVPFPGSLHSFDATVTDGANTAINGAGQVRAPWVSNITGGWHFVTEHVWTRSSPQLNDTAGAEAVLDDPSIYPAEDQIIANTQYIHFDDNAAPPIYGALSLPFPLWDPANGGPGRGDREDFCIRSRGEIFIKEAGKCWFICNSDDGFSLRIDGTEIGSAPNRGRGNTVMSVDLAAGVHDLEFIFWERGGGAGVSVFILKGVSETEPPFGEDSYELVQAYLNPADTDGDGMPNLYEIDNGLNPNVNDADLDKDGDGLTNLQDFQRGTRADTADTDADGFSDKVETGTGTFVSLQDTGTNPVDADTDDDGLNDGVETNSGTFVSASNTGTNPLVADTDTDTISDGDEVILGTNPHVANALPTNIAGGGTWTTEHLWTRGNPQLADDGTMAISKGALDQWETYPAEDRTIVQTQYLHFHDDVAPPWYVAESTPYPLWNPAVGGAGGFGQRDDFCIRSRGKLNITRSGLIWFVCNSDDGFNLVIDGNEVGSAGLRGRTNSVVSAELTAGLHDLEIVHSERDGGAGFSLMVFRGSSESAPPVSAGLWQLVEAAAVAPSTPLAITSFSYNAGTTTLNLSFSSEAGATYALEYSTGLQPAGAPTSAAKWNVVPGYGSINGSAGTTAITPLNTSTLVTPGGQLPDNSTSYFRIRKL